MLSASVISFYFLIVSILANSYIIQLEEENARSSERPIQANPTDSAHREKILASNEKEASKLLQHYLTDQVPKLRIPNRGNFITLHRRFFEGSDFLVHADKLSTFLLSQIQQLESTQNTNKSNMEDSAIHSSRTSSPINNERTNSEVCLQPQQQSTKPTTSKDNPFVDAAILPSKNMKDAEVNKLSEERRHHLAQG